MQWKAGIREKEETLNESIYAKNIEKMIAWKYFELEMFYSYIYWGWKKIQVIASLYCFMCTLPREIFQKLYF